MSAIFNIPIGKGSNTPDQNKERKSRSRGSFPARMVFKVSGERLSIAECLSRTGMTDAAFRKKYSRLIGNQYEPTWGHFKCK